MRRLLPDPGPVDPAALIDDLGLAAQAPGDRPYVIANFVSSVDGRAAVDGGSTGLGDAGDTAMFRALRASADAVLAGTGTLATEHYGPLARDPAVVALRARRGHAAQPPLVTITRFGTVPGIPLLDDPDSTLILYTDTEPRIPGTPRAHVHVERAPGGRWSAAAVLADLRARHGIRLLLCEGGPSIFGDLVARGVCDELFLTLSAQLAGGDPTPITRRLELAAPRDVTLLWVLEQDGSLFLRYRLAA